MVRKKKEKKKELMISSKKKTTAMDIPNDVIIEIFSRLPVKSLLRFRWTCKSWFNLIRDPSFVNMQLKNNINHKPNNNNPLVLIYFYNIKNCNLKLKSYNIDDDDHTLLCANSLVSVKVPSLKKSSCPIKILGSCNGLLCIGVRTFVLVREKYFIWNPCTKEYKMANSILIGNDGCYNRYGFGYDRTIDDYKLVKTATHVHNGDHETCVYVYTLGTDSWKTVRSSYEFKLCSKADENLNGLFIGGHLYFTAMKKSSRTFDIIVSFDIAKEEYEQIPIPDICRDGFLNPDLELGELNGCLCLVSKTGVGLWDTAEVWMMRHYNVENNIYVKEEYTWEKLCTINSAQERWCSWGTKLLRFCKNGEILMVEESLFRREIVLYDPKSGKITSLREVSTEQNVEKYMEILVSLNSGTYMM